MSPKRQDASHFQEEDLAKISDTECFMLRAMSGTQLAIQAAWPLSHFHSIQRSVLLAAMTIVCSDAAFARSTVYRCTQPNGAITYSDKPCPGGDLREGNNWTTADELDRRRKAEAEWAKRADLERRRREDTATQARALAHQQAGAAATTRGLNSSPSAGAVDRMTTYSVVLGRAIGCGIGVDAQLKRVGAWFDVEFPADANKALFMGAMAEGMRKNAQLQKSGNSPDSCSSVRTQINEFPWP